MKVLFLSAVLPYPLFSGGQIRIYNLIKRLAKTHDIWLYSFIREEKEKQWLNELTFCQHVTTVYRGRAWQPKYIKEALLGQYPFLLSTYDSKEMRKRIAADLKKEKFDLIHIEPGYVWPSLPETISPIVISEHNVEHYIYEEYTNSASPLLKRVMQRDVRRLKSWEKTIWSNATRITAVSDTDAAEINSMSSRSVDIVPNGVDETHFIFAPPKKLTSDFCCLFVGNFRWLQNTDAVKFLLEQVWPLVNRKFPEARLSIVGRDFPLNLKQFITPSITYEEHVDDIVDAFQEADILLAPIRIGGGTKYKVLEAMASGVPVITTEKGVEGLTSSAKKAVILADSPREWVDAIEKLLSDNELRNGLISRARKDIEKEYTWSKISQSLGTVWEKAYEQIKS